MVCSADLATKVHRRTYEILGVSDPYASVKARSNSVAAKLLPKAEAFIQSYGNRLEAAIICSLAGNILDFGIEGSETCPEALADKFDTMCSAGIQVNDLPEVMPYLKSGANILLFADNCGEIVFDKLLCIELKKFDIHLCLVVKGEPILSDATIDDVKFSQLENIVDDVMTTNAFAVGVDFNRIDDKLQRAIETADLIICKGMANFESFSETTYHPIVYILRTKCAPVANAMGLPKNINAVKLYPSLYRS
jgi:hypothetical protein